MQKNGVLEQSNDEVSLAGRIMLKRVMGKASFVQLQDSSGQIQLFVTRDELGDSFYNDQFKKWDIGDIIGVIGVLFKTKTGELSVRVNDIKLLTKSLRPLPEKFHGLSDQETIYRQRYVDLIVNENSRKVFQLRSQIIAYIRQFFIDNGYLEVETPMMQVIPGGARAKPFVTHHKALDMELFLRIAPELYLKRLIVGGLERVFEINRNFRNEGLSTRHNPEFTMIEFYEAYATYHDFMDLTENLLKGIAIDVCKSNKIHYQGYDFDFSKSFDRLSVFDSILKYNTQLKANDLSEENAKKTAKKLDINLKDGWGLGRVQIEIFEATVEEKLFNQPLLLNIQQKFLLYLGVTMRIRSQLTDLSFLLVVERLLMVFLSLTMQRSKLKGFTSKLKKKTLVMMKQCIMTLIIFVLWSMVCHLLLVRG